MRFPCPSLLFWSSLYSPSRSRSSHRLCDPVQPSVIRRAAHAIFLRVNRSQTSPSYPVFLKRAPPTSSGHHLQRLPKDHGVFVCDQNCGTVKLKKSLGTRNESEACRKEMADQQLELYHERRKKRKRAATGFFVTVVAVAQHIYCRRRMVELGDFREEEAKTRIRKQMLRNIHMGPNLYCYDTLRFTKRSSSNLCAILRERAGLKDTFYVTIEEATPATELPKDYKRMWFLDVLGALDGTHVDVRVPLHKQGRYRNRKKAITTNVLGICDRNMKFVFVLAGWEGSASDGRVLRDAMFREDSFKVPNGKYYLVDAGYTNSPGFFAPFRNTRYQLKEWAANGNNPETPQELYNLWHAIARNVVERIWALLKMRWVILKIRVINACCILHNFLADR